MSFVPINTKRKLFTAAALPAKFYEIFVDFAH